MPALHGDLKHVDRRNRIVHAGRHVNEEEAEASFKAAISLMGHVNAVMIETGVRLGKLRVVGTEARADPDPYYRFEARKR